MVPTCLRARKNICRKTTTPPRSGRSCQPSRKNETKVLVVFGSPTPPGWTAGEAARSGRMFRSVQAEGISGVWRAGRPPRQHLRWRRISLRPRKQRPYRKSSSPQRADNERAPHRPAQQHLLEVVVRKGRTYVAEQPVAISVIVCCRDAVSRSCTAALSAAVMLGSSHGRWCVRRWRPGPPGGLRSPLCWAGQLRRTLDPLTGVRCGFAERGVPAREQRAARCCRTDALDSLCE